METEQHYIVDALAQDIPSEYLTECGVTDTRLIKIHTKNENNIIIRPPSFEPRKRLDFPNESYTEIQGNFKYLLGELQEFDIKYHNIICLYQKYIHQREERDKVYALHLNI